MGLGKGVVGTTLRVADAVFDDDEEANAEVGLPPTSPTGCPDGSGVAIDPSLTSISALTLTQDAGFVVAGDALMFLSVVDGKNAALRATIDAHNELIGATEDCDSEQSNFDQAFTAYVAEVSNYKLALNDLNANIMSDLAQDEAWTGAITQESLDTIEADWMPALALQLETQDLPEDVTTDSVISEFEMAVADQELIGQSLQSIWNSVYERQLAEDEVAVWEELFSLAR